MSVAARRHDMLDVLLAHRGRLVEVAQRILKCRALAEDVVQDVAIKICETRPGAMPSNPHAYLARMVRNLALDNVRRTAFECRLLAPISAAEAAASPCPCPLERIESRETLRAVAAALADAPARARKAFLAHRLDAVPQTVIAAELGVSPTLVNFMIKDATLRCRHATSDPAWSPTRGCGDPRRSRARLGARPGRDYAEVTTIHAG